MLLTFYTNTETEVQRVSGSFPLSQLANGRERSLVLDSILLATTLCSLSILLFGCSKSVFNLFHVYLLY